jgi:hypothetical protein
MAGAHPSGPTRRRLPGRPLELGALTFAGPVTFTVSLRHVDGAPVRAARLALEGRGGGDQTASFTRLPDGTWQSAPVQPGAYILRAWGETFAILEREVAVAADGSARAELTVDPGTPVRFVLRLPPTTVLHAPETYLTLYDARRRLLFSERLVDGHASAVTLTCGLAPGEYRAEAFVFRLPTQVKRVFTVPTPRTEPLEVDLDLAGAK